LVEPIDQVAGHRKFRCSRKERAVRFPRKDPTSISHAEQEGPTPRDARDLSARFQFRHAAHEVLERVFAGSPRPTAVSRTDKKRHSYVPQTAPGKLADEQLYLFRIKLVGRSQHNVETRLNQLTIVGSQFIQKTVYAFVD